MNVKALTLAALRKLPTAIAPVWGMGLDAQQATPPSREALEGAAAFDRGVPLHHNPYALGTQQHEDWNWAWQEWQEWQQDWQREAGLTAWP